MILVVFSFVLLLLAAVSPTGFGDLRCARAPRQRRSAREYFR